MGPCTIWCDGLCMLWCDGLYTDFYKKKFIYIKTNLKNIYVCPSSKSVLRVGHRSTEAPPHFIKKKNLKWLKEILIYIL